MVLTYDMATHLQIATFVHKRDGYYLGIPYLLSGLTQKIVEIQCSRRLRRDPARLSLQFSDVRESCIMDTF